MLENLWTGHSVYVVTFDLAKTDYIKCILLLLLLLLLLAITVHILHTLKPT